MIVVCARRVRGTSLDGVNGTSLFNLIGFHEYLNFNRVGFFNYLEFNNILHSFSLCFLFLFLLSFS